MRNALRKMCLLAALLIPFVSTAPAVAQSEVREGWKAARGPAGLYFETPREFETARGTGPGFIAQTPFTLNYLSARNVSRGMFVSAGTGIIPLSQDFDEDELAVLSEKSLESFFHPLSLPGIGVFTCDPRRAETSEYKALNAYVRETTARSQSTAREYRIYFAFTLKPAGFMRAKLIYLVAGGREEDIEDINRVMSTILASFKVG